VWSGEDDTPVTNCCGRGSSGSADPVDLIGSQIRPIGKLICPAAVHLPGLLAIILIDRVV